MKRVRIHYRADDLKKQYVEAGESGCPGMGCLGIYAGQ
jgi:hypothetical protein